MEGLAHKKGKKEKKRRGSKKEAKEKKGRAPKKRKAEEDPSAGAPAGRSRRDAMGDRLAAAAPARVPYSERRVLEESERRLRSQKKKESMGGSGSHRKHRLPWDQKLGEEQGATDRGFRGLT